MPQNDPPNFGEWFSEWSSPGKGREFKSPGPKPPVNQWLKGWEPPNVDGLHQERAKKSKVILIFQNWSSFSPLFDVHFGGKHQFWRKAPAHQRTSTPAHEAPLIRYLQALYRRLYKIIEGPLRGLRKDLHNIFSKGPLSCIAAETIWVLLCPLQCSNASNR